MKTPKSPKLKQPPVILTPELDVGPWTSFWDMNSGGGQKEDVSHIFIQASETEAKAVFFSRFGHNPDRVTCTCCGPDYSVDEKPSLWELTAYERGCGWDKEKRGYSDTIPSKYGEKKPPVLLSAYLLTPDNWRLVPATDIKPHERIVEVPKQGYIWQD
jgi:hypothetical protein